VKGGFGREGEIKITITIKKEVPRPAVARTEGGSILGSRGTGERHALSTFCEPSEF
jgi:hypothetical protein